MPNLAPINGFRMRCILKRERDFLPALQNLICTGCRLKKYRRLLFGADGSLSFPVFLNGIIRGKLFLSSADPVFDLCSGVCLPAAEKLRFPFLTRLFKGMNTESGNIRTHSRTGKIIMLNSHISYFLYQLLPKRPGGRFATSGPKPAVLYHFGHLLLFKYHVSFTQPSLSGYKAHCHHEGHI